MPKRKKFIDKKKSVVFQMVYQPVENPKEGELHYKKAWVHVPENYNRTKEYEDYSEKMINKFIDKEWIKKDKKRYEKLKEERRKLGPYIPQEVMDKIRQQGDLWINKQTILKDNIEQEYDIQIEDDKYDDEEEEEVEEFDDDDEMEELSDFDMEEFEQEFGNYIPGISKIPGINEISGIQKKFGVQNNIEMSLEKQKPQSKQISEEIQRVDKDIHLINPNVRMKYFDQYGIEEDGGPKQIVTDDDPSEGITVFSMNAQYKVAPKLAPDIDYKLNEMTKEQREVFDALNSDNENGIYENIEDDFVNIANEGEDIFLKGGKKSKKVTFNLENVLDKHIKDRKLENELAQEKKLLSKQEDDELNFDGYVELEKYPDEKTLPLHEWLPEFEVTGAMKQYLERTEDQDIEFDENLTTTSHQTRKDMVDNIARVHLKDMFVEHQKVNMIKEQRTEKRKPSQKIENMEEEIEEEEEPLRPQDYCQKRKRKETKEERKKRKEKLKEFKKQRRQRKQKFKNKFQDVRKTQLKIEKKQKKLDSNGLSIYNNT